MILALWVQKKRFASKCWVYSIGFSHQTIWLCFLCAVLCLVIQSCLTLCNPMDCSLPDSSVHGDSSGKNTGVGCHACLQGIFPTQVSCIAGGFFTSWATRVWKRQVYWPSCACLARGSSRGRFMWWAGLSNVPTLMHCLYGNPGSLSTLEFKRWDKLIS